MMNRLRQWTYCSLIVLAIPVASLAQTRRIAVYDFSYTAVRGDVVQVFGSDKAVGAQVSSKIIGKLVSKGDTFDVIDRSQIDSIMKEQNLKFSDRFDPHDGPRLGKLLNVDAIVTGSVDEIASQVKNNRVGIGAVGVGSASAVADVTVSVRVISTETGRILIADQINKHESYSLGKGGQYKGNGGVDGGTNPHPGAIPAEKALQAAGDEIASKIISKANDLPSRGGPSSSPPSRVQASDSQAPARTTTVASAAVSTRAAAPTPPPLPSPAPAANTIMVGRIDGNKIFITGGQDVGLKVNDYLDVQHVTGTMKDSRGADIETYERVDRLVITQVEDRFSIAAPARAGAPIVAKVGDRVKKAAAPPPAPRPAAPPVSAAPKPAATR